MPFFFDYIFLLLGLDPFYAVLDVQVMQIIKFLSENI